MKNKILFLIASCLLVSPAFAQGKLVKGVGEAVVKREVTAGTSAATKAAQQAAQQAGRSAVTAGVGRGVGAGVVPPPHGAVPVNPAGNVPAKGVAGGKGVSAENLQQNISSIVSGLTPTAAPDPRYAEMKRLENALHTVRAQMLEQVRNAPLANADRATLENFVKTQTVNTEDAETAAFFKKNTPLDMEQLKALKTAGDFLEQTHQMHRLRAREGRLIFEVEVPKVVTWDELDEILGETLKDVPYRGQEILAGENGAVIRFGDHEKLTASNPNETMNWHIHKEYMTKLGDFTGANSAIADMPLLYNSSMRLPINEDMVDAFFRKNPEELLPFMDADFQLEWLSRVSKSAGHISQSTAPVVTRLYKYHTASSAAEKTALAQDIYRRIYSSKNGVVSAPAQWGEETEKAVIKEASGLVAKTLSQSGKAEIAAFYDELLNAAKDKLTYMPADEAVQAVEDLIKSHCKHISWEKVALIAGTAASALNVATSFAQEKDDD